MEDGRDVVVLQELIESARKGLRSSQEPNPYGRVDEHHQATLRLVADLGRRRGTSDARGSEPRSSRKR